MPAATANHQIRILCLEDNPDDRALLEYALRRDGLPCEFVHVQTKNAFETALGQQRFDLILSDFSLPSYDGMSALAAARKIREDTPFIFVSGTIGEERAIESLKSGATDYVLKDRRDRLIAAVRRALREAHEQRQRKQLEEQLRQAQKMDAIGQLAGGVAHDFNNLLAIIQGNAELALEEPGMLSDQIRGSLREITAASERAVKLTSQLLAFGRKQTAQLQSINLNSVIENLVSMLRRLIREDIKFQCNLEPGSLFTEADSGMIDQIILNLVVNARDAMAQGGDLQLTTTRVQIDEEYTQLNPEARKGNFIRLSVSDTGCGIAPEHLPHIFEPFYTTKDVGRGTGLGLATVYGIVQQHNGWIEVHSEVGAGTTIHVLLPAIETEAKTATPVKDVKPRCGGGERVLLVEDEPGVRLMAKRILEKHGYEVSEAASGREALGVWQGLGTEIQLLLTDVVMPNGMTGPQLVAELRRYRPELKVVFMSGHSLDVVTKSRESLSRHSSYILQKPFRPSVLVEIVRHCLDGAAI